VTLTVLKLRPLPFETATIERYKRRENAVEEALWGSKGDAASCTEFLRCLKDRDLARGRATREPLRSRNVTKHAKNSGHYH